MLVIQTQTLWFVVELGEHSIVGTKEPLKPPSNLNEDYLNKYRN